MSVYPTHRALVVDDSRAARIAAARLIEPYGFDVELSEDVALARHALATRPLYDFVLVDLLMPGQGGHDLLRLMRAQGNYTPVIVMTSGAGTRLTASAIRLGAADFLTKPLSAAEVHRAMARALNVPPDALRPEEPRVLVAGPEDLKSLVSAALPPHVAVDHASLGGAAEELLTERPFRLAVIDLREGGAAGQALAERALAVQPSAALCGVAHRSGTAVPHLDVVTSVEELPALLSGSLYPNTVRPLVLHDHASAALMGFQGEGGAEALYFAVAERRLCIAVSLLAAAGVAAIRIDLSAAPARSGPVARMARAALAATRGRIPAVRLVVSPVARSDVERLGLGASVEAPEGRTGRSSTFRWTVDLATGVSTVDQQHQELFLRVDRLLDTLGTDAQAEAAREALAFLEEYVQVHFADEERLMVAAHYPSAREHIAQHRAFRGQVLELAAEVNGGVPGPEFPRRLERGVCDWLYHHVQRSDRALGHFLSQHESLRA